MTRINVGIKPAELSDKHLIAEIHEITRVWTTAPPQEKLAEFRLGTGHVKWCSQYIGGCALRLDMLLNEAIKIRKFNYNKSDYIDFTYYVFYKHFPTFEIQRARPLLIQRINERIKASKRPHTWTNRQPPAWVA